MGLLERIDAERQPQNFYPGKEFATPFRTGGFDLERELPFFRSGPEKYVDSNEIYSIVSLRARLLSGLPLKLFAGAGDVRAKVTAGPVHDLLRHVNPFWTWKRLARMDELSMGIWGESFWAIEKDRAGTPRNIWWLKPNRVTPVPDADNYLKGFLYAAGSTAEAIPFTADEVVWFRYPNPVDEYSALSPLAAARLAADTARAMQLANRNLFENGLNAAGIVVPTADKVTFGEEQADELEDFLDKRMRGVDKSHRWSVLRFDAEFKGLNVTPKDAEYVEGTNMTLRAACNAYGVPAPLMNEMSASTLTNVREYQRQLWEHTLISDADFKAAEINEQLLPMFRRSLPKGQRVDEVEHDYSKVPALQESASEVWTREYQAIDRGALTINEWRGKHGLDPVPWGDVFWAPVNKEPVEDGSTAPTEPVDQAAKQVQAINRQFEALGERLAVWNRQ